MTRPESKPAENPLVPHAVLRSIFSAMVQARLLDEHSVTPIAGQRRARESIRGEEALRASSVACLEAGDLVSDGSRSPAADLLLGSPMRALLRAPRAGQNGKISAAPLSPRRLPLEEDGPEQVRTALGAAHALRIAGTKRLVLVYVRASAVPVAFWKEALARAGERSLPIVFLLLPQFGTKEERAAAGRISERAMIWGVPGIAVDAVDAVALYRVLRESTARARAGDGPVLIECIHWKLDGKPGRPADPLLAIANALVTRGVAGEAWQKRVVERLTRRLAAAPR